MNTLIIPRTAPDGDLETYPDGCARCGNTVVVGRDDEISGRAIGRTRITADGRILVGIANGGMIEAAYCSTCSRTVNICRNCGCTDEAPCQDGCYWFEPGLCSACRVQRAA